MTNFPLALASKLPKTGTTIFAVMSKLAHDHGAINLSQGFPDFECSGELISLVNKYMKKGYNQYAPMQGVPALREIISEKTEERYSAKYHPEKEVNITAGATLAIYTAITATIKEGDEVILFEPAYDCYAPAVELNGGVAVYVQMDLPDYRINWQQVQKLIKPRTKMIIINTPHNPTGSILTAADMIKLDKLTRGTGIIIVSDEVYEHIIFDGYEHQSVARFPGLAQRSFIISSFGKTFHTTGWKMGYCLAPENLMKEFRKVHQYIVFTCNTPVQYALADFLKKKDNYEHLSEFYQKKRDLFMDFLKNSKFKFKPSMGTYFQLFSYSGITREKDTEYAIRLTKEIGVASIPVSVFYHRPVDNKILRFCFAKSEETLKKAAEKLMKL